MISKLNGDMPYVGSRKFTWDAALFLPALYHRSHVQKDQVANLKVVILDVSPMYKELNQGG